MNRIHPHPLVCAMTVAMVVAVSVRASEPPANERYQNAARAYHSADSRGKLQFLESLLSRSDAACSVSMHGAPLERQRARNRAILSRAAEGRELTSGGLEELLAEVDEHEQRAIAKLLRDYTFSTAQAFHDNRVEFDRWMDAWERIERRYEQDERPLAWQPRMIDWLALATARQAQFSIARLGLEDAPRTAQPRTRAVPPRRGPSIQQAELEARITGYNLAAARLLSELHAQRTWSVEALGHAAAELGDLSMARHDLHLYWDLLPPSVQAHMTPLRPLENMISQLAAHASDRRRELEQTSNESPRAAWELRRLNEISRRLATLSTASDQAGLSTNHLAK